MRRVIPLNFGWRYADSFCEDYLKENADETGFVEVDLPHTNRELPYNYFDESEFQFISCYRKHFDIPLEYKGKRIFVDFEGVMCYAEVYVNGVYAGEHKGGYTPFSIDITDKVRFGENNVLSVKVDSTERPDIPPFGNVVDYLTYGGIYREVSLRVVNPVYIANAFFAPSDVLQTDKEIRAKVFVSNPEQKAGETVVCVALKDGDTVISEQRKTLQLTGDDKVMVEIVLSGIRDVELW
ncbi:MAG: sugar-binding domain-containing protein, partial [Bacillota bacterium]